MRGAVLYGPRDVRLEERGAPKIIEPTNAILRLPASCGCGSDLWPYRGVDLVAEPMPMGHEYCGIVEEIGQAATTVERGQFVVGSFFASDNSCPPCQAGYPSSCAQREVVGGAQAGRICRRPPRCGLRATSTVRLHKTRGGFPPGFSRRDRQRPAGRGSHGDHEDMHSILTRWPRRAARTDRGIEARRAEAAAARRVSTPANR